MKDLTDQPTETYRLAPPSPFDRTFITPEQADAERAARTARIMAALEDQWLTRHLEAGGTADEWPQVRNELRRRHLVERAGGPSEVERHSEILRATGLFNRM